MQGKIKNIQVFNQQGSLIYECSKNFAFPTKYVGNKPVDNVLMIKGRSLPDLRRGSAVDILITTKAEERIKYYCQVTLSTEHQLNLALNSTRARALEEKRRFYKIATELNCRIVDMTRNGQVTAYNPNLYGKIRDINIGGMFGVVANDVTYQPDDIISLTAIMGESRLEIMARVLRIQTAENGDILGYGCAFTGVSAQQEEIISSYINRVQMEERRLELEKEKLEKEIGGRISLE